MRSVVDYFDSQQQFIEAQASVNLVAQRYLESFDWKRVVEFRHPAINFSLLQASTIALTRSYTSLIQAVSAMDPPTLPLVVYDLPPLDVTGHASFLWTLVEPEEVESSSEGEVQQETQLLLAELRGRVANQLEPRLGKLHDGFPKMWVGARQALHSSNPDRFRHAAVSIRELVTQILHLLAPDDEIRQWTSKPELYDEKKRPTRRARILYICRHVTTDRYAGFVDRILAGTLAKLDLLQRGTHRIESSFDDHQLEALCLALGGDILLLIESADS